jgi:hypothetical protein
MKISEINKKIAKILPMILCVLILTPVFALAQQTLIPCTNDCDFNDLLKLVNNIIEWIVFISTPVAAGVFAWAGFTYMTTGVVDERTKAKNMIQKVFLGFVFILAAWLLVSTILNALLADEFKNAVPVELNQ